MLKDLDRELDDKKINLETQTKLLSDMKEQKFLLDT